MAGLPKLCVQVIVIVVIFSSFVWCNIHMVACAWCFQLTDYM